MEIQLADGVHIWLRGEYEPSEDMDDKLLDPFHPLSGPGGGRRDQTDP